MRVTTESQLQAAVANLASNTTILLAPGTYQLSGPLYISNVSNVAIRGETNNRDDVVLVGSGMTNGAVRFGIWTQNVQGLLIANLTVRDVYEHPIILNANSNSVRVYNVHLKDSGQQLLKSNPGSNGVGNANGIVEYSLLDYTTTSPDYYTNGVDVTGGTNWIIRDNVFQNIRARRGSWPVRRC